MEEWHRYHEQSNSNPATLDQEQKILYSKGEGLTRQESYQQMFYCIAWMQAQILKNKNDHIT